jgi:hypothetical protein
MPTISIFFGIVVQMYWNDHAPPHVHAFYQGQEALFEIGSSRKMAGALPRKAERLVSDWITANRDRLFENLGLWQNGSSLLADTGRRPAMIELIKVSKIEPRSGHVLHVVFSNGDEGDADFSWLLEKDWPMVDPLRDSEFFSKAFVSFGVPTWPNGFDVDAINLHRQMSEQGGLKKRAA